MPPGAATHRRCAGCTAAARFSACVRLGLVVGDMKLARDRDLHRVERQAVPPPLGAEQRDALAELLGRGILIEDQVEAALGGAADRGVAGGRDPERRMRLLRRRRLDHDVVELPEPAAMREALARDERLGHHLDRFLEARLGLLDRDAEARELVVPVALADAEIEAGRRRSGRASPPARRAAPDCARAARSPRCRAAASWCAWRARSAASAWPRPGSSR